jgi:hypothetical protein
MGCFYLGLVVWNVHAGRFLFTPSKSVPMADLLLLRKLMTPIAKRGEEGLEQRAVPPLAAPETRAWERRVHASHRPSLENLPRITCVPRRLPLSP